MTIPFSGKARHVLSCDQGPYQVSHSMSSSYILHKPKLVSQVICTNLATSLGPHLIRFIASNILQPHGFAKALHDPPLCLGREASHGSHHGSMTSL